MAELWYASGKKHFSENEPAFFDPRQQSWAVEIENHWAELKPELDALIAEQDKNFVSNEYIGIATNNGWSSLSFLFWGYRQQTILKSKCPKLTAYLEKVPGLVSASLSRLAPQTTINEHRGDTNGVFRCHLGIEVPASLPECGIRVGNEQQGWAEGKWLFFNDAWKHSAWNKTDKRRIVLIMDVIRPEFMSKKRMICTNILARHVLFHYQAKNSFVKKLPYLFKGMLFVAIAMPLYLRGPKTIA
jgi:aspartyl/asparaginyl beta-hydroxylase (cupin superfamily)